LARIRRRNKNWRGVEKNGGTRLKLEWQTRKSTQKRYLNQYITMKLSLAGKVNYLDAFFEVDDL